jgi:hypothetical protein
MRKSTGIGLLGLMVVLVLAALDRLDSTWALIVVGILAVLAVLDEVAAHRPIMAVAWAVVMGAGVTAFLVLGRWWAVGAVVVATMIVTPLANREIV